MKRYDVYESRDGKAFVIWDRKTRSRYSDDRFRLEREAQVVVDAMNATNAELDSDQPKAFVPQPARELIYAAAAGAR